MNLVIELFDVMANSRTCVMKFKDFQAPLLFSSTFKDVWEPWLCMCFGYT